MSHARLERVHRRTWRDADLAQKGGPRPSSVRGVVRATTRSLLALRLVEGALLTVAFACGTMAAALWSGLPGARLDAVLVAFVTGVFGGLAWFLEQRRREGQVARSLDRRLRHGGALVTAWELERAGADQPLERLCIERVIDKLRTREALRVLVPSVAPPVLLPLVGATLLGLALDSKRGVEEERFLPLEGLEGQLDALRDGAFESREAGEIGDEALRNLLGVKSDLDELRIKLGSGEPPADARERVQEMDRTLAEMAPEIVSDPELARDVDRMRSYLDALRDGLDEDGAGSESTAGDDSSSAAQGQGGSQAGGAEDAGVAGSSGTGEAGGADSGSGALAGAGADGTMSGTSDPSGAASDDAAAPSDRGTAARVWWDRIDDPLVSDWVELLREAEGRLDPAETGARPGGEPGRDE